MLKYNRGGTVQHLKCQLQDYEKLEIETILNFKREIFSSAFPLLRIAEQSKKGKGDQDRQHMLAFIINE